MSDSKQLPYVDASHLDDDAASFVSTNPPPSYRTTDASSIAPSTLSSPPNYSNKQATPVVAPAAASGSVATPITAADATSPSPDDNPDKIIMTSIPVVPSSSDGGKARSPSNSLLGRFKPANKLKIVLMPQSEYAKHFAKDAAGKYVGTEPQRQWTEAELDERYARYKSALPPAPMQVGSAWKEGGGRAVSWGFAGSTY